jgi:Flp pilus assembly protein TadG
MIRRLARQNSGSAAAEMALVTPLLIALMLG